MNDLGFDDRQLRNDHENLSRSHSRIAAHNQTLVEENDLLRRRYAELRELCEKARAGWDAAQAVMALPKYDRFSSGPFFTESEKEG